jgi:hypothetical protein
MSLSPAFWMKKNAIGNFAGCVGQMERGVALTAAATKSSKVGHILGNRPAAAISVVPVG